MLELEARPNDDPAFVDLASRLIAGAAIARNFHDLIAVHIDHWFGDRWLGFCGKLLGAAGVRTRRGASELTPPPFHPHRVQSTRAYYRTASGSFTYWDDVRSLHEFRPSQSNLRRTLRKGRLYAWYSGDTIESDKGVVMVYAVAKTWNRAWYVAFDKTPRWHMAQTVAISPQRVHDLIGL